jgi:hypothetical protein
MHILQILWCADRGKRRSVHTPTSPLVLVPLINSFYEMLILQINWSADAGKGRSACGAHSHQPPSLSTFDKQFL